MRLWFVLGVAALSVLSGPVRADALLAQALEPAAEDMQRVWTVQRTGQDFDASGKLKSRTVAVFNGTKTARARWTLVSINGEAPSASDQSDFQAMFKGNALPPSYALVQSIVPASAEKIDETATQARYHVARMPAGTTVVKGIDLSKFTVADITVDKRAPLPYISEVRVYAPQSFKPMPGSKVKSLERVLRFALGSDGVPILKSHRMTADASVLFKQIVVSSTADFTNQAMTPLLAHASLKR